jgi:nicotinamidase-related amidase
MSLRELAVPPHFDAKKVGEVWRVPYQDRAAQAEKWAKQHNIPPASHDDFRFCLMPVDVQNTFCIPDFELFVAGRSSTGAVDDNRRLCEFIYRNLHNLNTICPTMDTHQALQIFHSVFLVNEDGEHPAPFTLVSEEDVKAGGWKVNPQVVEMLGMNQEYVQRYLAHYTHQLKEGGKYELTVWPYHAMLGGIGHALVSAVEEAIFFHSIARRTQPDFQIKGNNPLTENYSILSPEVLDDAGGEPIAQKNTALIKRLLEFDAVIIAGQAKSHCVAWTIEDLINEIRRLDKRLVEKVYLLEDCMSPVVIPNVVDYTDQADAAFKKFAEAGAHVVQSTDAMETWPDLMV